MEVNVFDAENTIYTELAKKLRDKYDGIYITGTIENVPPQFPCVSIVLVDSPTYERSLDGKGRENHSHLVFDINTYSNLAEGKKSQCAKIMQDIDDYMLSMMFVRKFRNPVPNYGDRSIYRMVARYASVLNKNNGQISRY